MTWACLAGVACGIAAHGRWCVESNQVSVLVSSPDPPSGGCGKREKVMQVIMGYLPECMYS